MEVIMREINHGRVGVTQSGVPGDGRVPRRLGCGVVGVTLSGDLGRGRTESGRGRAAGVTHIGDPSRGRVGRRTAALLGSSSVVTSAAAAHIQGMAAFWGHPLG